MTVKLASGREEHAMPPEEKLCRQGVHRRL